MLLSLYTSGALGLGGPVHRRRGKENELPLLPDLNNVAIGSPDGVDDGLSLSQELEEEELLGSREGRNLANVFPFVGGETG